MQNAMTRDNGDRSRGFANSSYPQANMRSWFISISISLVVYAMSMGPAMWLADKWSASGKWFGVLYLPLTKVVMTVPKSISPLIEPYRNYVKWWIPQHGCEGGAGG